MTLITVIFSLAVAIGFNSEKSQYSAPSSGFMVIATIDAARILGLPFMKAKKSLTPEQKHDDVVWVMAEVIGPEEQMPRRKKFIQELVTSNRITNFLKY
jgi:hypothetical protein